MSRNPHSTATIGRHPMHPMLVPLPIGLFVAALVADLVFWRNGSAAAASAAFWLLAGGVATAALAALAGGIDFFGDRRVRMLGAAKMPAAGNVIAVLIEIANLFAHGSDNIVPTGLILSAVTVIIVGFTGWMGGEMVYRHAVGIAPEAEDRG